jgi:2-octaprenyl-6-methoxyphenol hydroxylase
MQNVAILGLGLNGLALAYCFAKSGIGVTIFDENPFKQTFADDLRTSFISHKTMDFLGEISQSIIEQSGKIEYIYSFKNDGKAVVELKSEMGYIVDNAVLKSEMAKYIESSQYVKICDNVKIESIVSNGDNTIINGQKFDLAVCALGRSAKLCADLNIKEYQYDYKQNAFVFDIKHAKSHKNIAVEVFGDGYILAVLPKKDELSSSVVLNISNDSGDMKSDELLAFLQSLKRLRYVGEVSEISTKVLKYPLTMRALKTQNKNAIFFIGDTFHTVHPVLGQGFNMSIKDVENLVDFVVQNIRNGVPLNIGLDTLARKNVLNHLKIGFATHFFAESFVTKNRALNVVTNGLIKIGAALPSKLVVNVLQKFI